MRPTRSRINATVPTIATTIKTRTTTRGKGHLQVSEKSEKK